MSSTQSLSMSGWCEAVSRTSATASCGVWYADPATGKEEGRPRNVLPAPLLVADLEAEIAIETQRQDRGDAVLLVLGELRQDVLPRVGVGAVLSVGHQPHVPVRVDHPGHDGAAVHVDDAGALRHLDLAHRAHGRDAVALHDEHRVLARRIARPVDQACSLE